MGPPDKEYRKKTHSNTQNVGFIITSINGWRYIKQFGIATLPLMEDEEVIVIETIRDQDSSSAPSSVSRTGTEVELNKKYNKYNDEHNATVDHNKLSKLLSTLHNAVSSTKSNSRTNTTTPMLKTPNPKSLSNSTDSVKKSATVINKEDTNENRIHIHLFNCKTTTTKRSQSSGKLDGNHGHIYSNHNKFRIPQRRINCHKDINFDRSLGVYNLNINDGQLKRAHTLLQQRSHKANNYQKLQNTNYNNKMSVSTTTDRKSTKIIDYSMDMSSVNESSTSFEGTNTSKHSSGIRGRRQGLVVEKQAQLIQIGSTEYLHEVKDPDRKRRCCSCCRWEKAFCAKTESVPVIGDYHYADGTAGHFVVKRIKKKKDLQKLSLLLSIQWVLQNISNNMAFVVSAAYWILKFAGHSKVNDNSSSVWRVVNDHVLTMIFATVDMNLSSAPVRFVHFWMPMLFLLLWAFFTWLFWINGGRNQEGKAYIYQFLDYSKNPTLAVLVILLLAFVIIPAAQLIIYILFRLREMIFSKVYKVKKKVIKHVKKRMTKPEQNLSSQESLSQDVSTYSDDEQD